MPQLRFKQDAVPGLIIHLHFKPTAIGEYEIACAELCGLGHYKMHGMVHVVSQEDFDKWVAAIGRRRRKCAMVAMENRLRFTRTLLRVLSGSHIFSLDHKVIGLQYFFLAFTAVFVGMFLSLLMRIRLAWPAVVLAALVGEIKPETYLSLLMMHGTIMAFFVLTIGAARRVRKLLSADSNRRARYGLPGPEHAFVLDDVRGIRCDHRGVSSSPAGLRRTGGRDTRR